MKKLLLVLFFAIVSQAFAQTPGKKDPVGINVTFKVNMEVAIEKNLFDRTTDTVVVRGDFQTDAGDAGGNWQGMKFACAASSSTDSIFTVKATFPATTAGTTYHFKFVDNHGNGWESNIPTSDGNRFFVQAATDQVLPAVYFSNDSIFIPRPTVHDTVTFVADLTGIWGSGDGHFDDTRDSILVLGLGDWNGTGKVIAGNRRLELINPASTGIYVTTLVLQGMVGDSIDYKYCAYPSNRFTNTGYETGQNHWYYFTKHDTTFSLPKFVPPIGATGILSADVTVTFRVGMNNSPLNAKNNLPIPVSKISFIAVKGSAAPIGAWAGNWTAADTVIASGASYPGLTRMYDDGTHGDAIPGDNIYSRSILFPSGSQAGLTEYKFACMYPGADTVNGGSTPLDNEYAFQLNHMFTVSVPKVGSAISLYNIWGNMTTDIRPADQGTTAKKEVSFKLEQNYPNPFNPSTKISFSIPKDGMVTLKVYDILGKEVGTLVNEQMKTGAYDVTFNASSLATGVYLYKINVGDFTSVKKMMLVK